MVLGGNDDKICYRCFFACTVSKGGSLVIEVYALLQIPFLSVLINEKAEMLIT
jgi:hypothetical protein